jgi:hypothetical protein
MAGASFQASMAHLHFLTAPPRRVSDNAREGIEKERRMSFASGCRMYPRAILWSVLLSLTIVMIAYQKMMVGGSFGTPAFQRQFGKLVPVPGEKGESYELSAPWQAALVNAAYATETIALLLNGILTDRYGYKKVLIGALVFDNLTILVSFFATNREVLLASQILSGMFESCFAVPSNKSRPIMGRIPDTFCNIRRRGSSSLPPDVPSCQRQHVLAHWPGHCYRRFECLDRVHRPVGLEDTLFLAMALLASSSDRFVLRAGSTMVACTARSRPGSSSSA